MSSSDLFDKAIAIINDARAKDGAGHYEEAMQLYTKAIENLMIGVKYEKVKSTKDTINDSIIKYLKRAEEIKVMLNKGGGKKAGGNGGGGGGSKEPETDADGKPIEKLDADTEQMRKALGGAIVREKPNIKWDDVAGLHVAKDMLKEAVILPIQFPQLFVGNRKPWAGILLYGPPGTGKSFLAKEIAKTSTAVATEANNSTFYSVSSSDLVSKYQGESERLVRNLFELARKDAPSIIFIDEIDSLCSTRSDGENDSARRIKTEFLVQMQGVGKANSKLLVLGATNTPWGLDPAIRRRFEKRIYIPLPDPEARTAMFKIHIGKDTPHALSDPDFAQLGQSTEGYSGSDISVLVRDALMQPIRKLQKAKRFKKSMEGGKTFYEPASVADPSAVQMSLFDIPSEQLKTPKVDMADFYQALENSKPSVGEEDIKQHVEWTTQYGMDG